MKIKSILLVCALLSGTYAQAQAPCQIGDCDTIGLPKEIKDLGGIQAKDRPVSGIRFYFGVKGADSKPVEAFSLSKKQVSQLNQLKGRESNHFLSKVLAKHLNENGGGKVSVNDIMSAYSKFGCPPMPLYHCNDDEPIIDIGRGRYSIKMKLVEK